ncbi:hypothetical protein M569_09966 [Genlisea aurea]|uniref:glucan endo-1,3-beta-D-glucosidase n=1 Tax=Genlisea aurea TaxID=192259 RepID=S8CCW9_9LAMI|nr:hypothetical protein M569_09966 [Genlisea aurea]
MKSLINFVLLFLISSAAATPIGVNYGRVADNLPSAFRVSNLLKTVGVTRVKIYDTDATVLNAFGGTGISVIVCLPNDKLGLAAGSQTFTDNWIRANILPYRATWITAIAIGNEVFSDPANLGFLVSAMENMHASLVRLGLDSRIKVSSPVPLDVLQSSYPPSAGAFKSDVALSVIAPMLGIMRRTGSYFMVNIYPFFAYSANSRQISLDYALGNPNAPHVVDPKTNLVYTNLFDAQVDAVYAAMAALGFGDVNIMVTETGWPSAGDPNEIGAGLNNAAAYDGNLARRVLAGSGTPMRPHTPLDVYLFALFNEDRKPGPTSERNYGLFYPDMRRVFNIPLHG